MQHLLEPPTKEEIEKAVHILKLGGEGAQDGCIFSSAQLIEPPKEAARVHEPDSTLARVIRLTGTGGLESGPGGFSADVDLTSGAIVGFNQLPGNSSTNSSRYKSDKKLLFANTGALTVLRLRRLAAQK